MQKGATCTARTALRYWNGFAENLSHCSPTRERPSMPEKVCTFAREQAPAEE